MCKNFIASLKSAIRKCYHIFDEFTHRQNCKDFSNERFTNRLIVELETFGFRILGVRVRRLLHVDGLLRRIVRILLLGWIISLLLLGRVVSLLLRRMPVLLSVETWRVRLLLLIRIYDRCLLLTSRFQMLK